MYSSVYVYIRAHLRKSLARPRFRIFPVPWKTPPWLMPVLPLLEGTHCSDIRHHWLILPLFELHLNSVIMKRSGFFSLNVMWDSAVLLHVSGLPWKKTNKTVLCYNPLCGDIIFCHSCVDGHLDPFHFLAIMNKTALNIPSWCTHVFICVWVDLEVMLVEQRAGPW